MTVDNVLDLFSLVDDSNDALDGSDRKENDDSGNQDVNMQYDEQGLNADDPNSSNGNGSRNMDVDDSDGHAPNEREKINPFSSRNRNNFNSGNDNSGYGARDSPAVIVNTNLLPFIQKLRDPQRMCIAINQIGCSMFEFLFLFNIFQLLP